MGHVPVHLLQRRAPPERDRHRRCLQLHRHDAPDGGRRPRVPGRGPLRGQPPGVPDGELGRLPDIRPAGRALDLTRPGEDGQGERHPALRDAGLHREQHQARGDAGVPRQPPGPRARLARPVGPRARRRPRRGRTPGHGPRGLVRGDPLLLRPVPEGHQADGALPGLRRRGLHRCLAGPAHLAGHRAVGHRPARRRLLRGRRRRLRPRGADRVRPPGSEGAAAGREVGHGERARHRAAGPGRAGRGTGEASARR